MTDTHSLQALRDKVAEGTFMTGVLPPGSELAAYKAFSGSLSAAKALHEELLPGWDFEVNNHVAEVRRRRVAFSAECLDEPARAWLLAILDALIWEAGE